MIQVIPSIAIRKGRVVKTRYHNDRTQKQAAVIIDKLAAAGIDPARITMFVNARQEDIIENRKTTIKLVARKPRG